ncbi:uncharacterized protein [Ptychodera flava]|uniref:uncharacterized protein n=1 Tax=Ptychodera flava TaxID=63121 RepID=UPI003969CA4A
MEILGKTFLERFDKCDPTWLYDKMLFKLKQQSYQTVDRYASLLQLKAEKARKTDKEILLYFMNGLKPPPQAFIAGMNPTDFTSAYEHAKTAEVVNKLQQEPEEEPAELTEEIKERIGQLKELVKEMLDIGSNLHEQSCQNDSQQTGKRRRKVQKYGKRKADSKAIRSNRRQGILHNISKCFRNSRDYSDSRICYNCGKPGHIARQCVKKFVGFHQSKFTKPAVCGMSFTEDELQVPFQSSVADEIRNSPDDDVSSASSQSVHSYNDDDNEHSVHEYLTIGGDHDNNAPRSVGSESEQAPYYEVEKVVRGRYRNGKLQYLVKWKDYSHKHNTWEDENNLNDAAREYLREHPVKVTGKALLSFLRIC